MTRRAKRAPRNTARSKFVARLQQIAAGPPTLTTETAVSTSEATPIQKRNQEPEIDPVTLDPEEPHAGDEDN